MLNYLPLIYFLIGFVWFCAVLIIATVTKKQVVPGTLVACVFTWPVTMYGYFKSRKTGQRSFFSPL